MLKWLVDWLKRFFNRPFGSKHPSRTAVSQPKVVQAPELTNADLEFLFTQLLEGVHQARGQEWALKYLQRMENRISVDRWLDWLERFGNKLLASPAPNNELATRLMELGELDIGEIGEFAYEIGMELLRRNLGKPTWQDTTAELIQEQEQSTETLAELPEQNIGGLVWEYPTSEAQTTTDEEELTANVGQTWDFYATEAETTTNESSTLEESHNWGLGEDDTTDEFPHSPTQETSIHNLGELWEYDTENTETTGIITPADSNEEAGISAADEASWDESLLKLQPNVAMALDELVVRLQQSASLVQQVAFGLIDKKTQPKEIVERSTNQLNAAAQAQAWFYQGLQQAKTGNLSAALESYDKALAICPDSYDYWFNRGLTLFHLGNYPEAIASYDKAIAIKPDFYKCWYNRGGTLCELGEFEAARIAFNKAIEIKPDYHEAWSSRGLVLHKLGRHQDAIKSYDKALQIQPKDHESWYYRGIALAEAGCTEEAIKSYGKALQVKPDYDSAWYNLGVALSNLERYEDAIAYYDRVLEIEPDYQGAWAMRSLALYKLGRYTDALTDSETALEIADDFYLGWYSRGVALSGLGRYEDAIASYNKVIELKPDYDLAWLNQGVALSNLGQFEQAITSLDQALKLRQDNYESWYGRGAALDKLGRWEEAIASYDKAVQIKPDNHEIWIDKGVALIQLGRLEEAIAAWDKAIAIQPEFYLAWYNRGVALDNLKRYGEAVESYDMAVQIQPDFDLAWYNRGVALFYLGQFEEAIASYDRALELKLDYWEAWIGRGSACENSAHCDWELSAFSALAATNPDLNKRGSDGKLASYEEALKYVHQDTYPEACGRLHLGIGNIYYDQAKIHPTPRNYWLQAVVEYEQALLTLTPQDFPQLHLEVSQSLIKALLGLGETALAQEFYQNGTELLQHMLAQASLTDECKKQLALKFLPFRQLGVDIAVQSGELAQAWEIAEYGKNACLTWQYGLGERLNSPSYGELQELLNPTTAIVYWHISPYCLRTWVIKDTSTEPLPVFTPVLNVWAIDELPVPEAVQRLVEFESWVQDWNQQYQEYSEATDKQSKSNYSWRMDMEQRLLNLKNILNISTIEQELEGITQLILIPHSHLHRFPIHALFNLDSPYPEDSSAGTSMTITYLPSAQIGLSLKSAPASAAHLPLLIVENPERPDYPPLKFAKVEAETISKLFNHHLRLQRSQATKKQVEKALASDYQIFHFTGHVTDNFAHPHQSELALAGEDKLTLEDITKKKLDYQLVTLSGCDVINFSTINTQYTGLVSAFLSRGVDCVVSSLWTVESPATALLMIEFYRRLQLNKSIPAALTEATAWLKELTAKELTKWYEDLLQELSAEGFRIRAHLATEMYRSSQMSPNTKVYNHPYYWAGFVIAGRLN